MRTLAMKKTTNTNNTFSTGAKGDLTLSALSSAMSRHVTACGYSVSADECAHVLSAMAAHRLLYIEGTADDDGGVLLAGAVASFLGCDGNATVCKADTVSLSSLMAGKDVISPLAEKLRAVIGSGRPSAVVIDDRAGADLSRVLSGLEGYFSDGNESCEVSYGGGSLVLPKNTYFIVFLPEGRALELIGEELSSLACPVVCDGTLTLITNDGEKEPTEVTAEELSELFGAAYLAHQPTEETWRRIDAIDALLSSRHLRGFGNDGYLTMEKYVSVYTACTGDCHRALDVLIESHISHLRGRASREDGEALVSLISKMTSELSLPRAQNAAGMLTR